MYRIPGLGEKEKEGGKGVGENGGGNGMDPTHDGMSNERALNGWGLTAMTKSGEDDTLLDDHYNTIV